MAAGGAATWPASTSTSPSGAVGELGDRADGRDQVGGTAVEGVVADDEGTPGHLQGGQVVQLVLAVVATGQDLEHRLASRDAALQPLGEEPDDLLGDRGQGLDPLGVVRGVRARRR